MAPTLNRKQVKICSAKYDNQQTISQFLKRRDKLDLIRCRELSLEMSFSCLLSPCCCDFLIFKGLMQIRFHLGLVPLDSS